MVLSRVHPEDEPGKPAAFSDAVAAQYVHAFLNPLDNAENLTPEYLAELDALPERHRRRYYQGIYVDEIENALWSMECIDHARIYPDEVPETMDRVVIAIDPSGTEGEEDTRSDAVGMGVAGRSGSHAYVFDDVTCRRCRRRGGAGRR